MNLKLCTSTSKSKFNVARLNIIYNKFTDDVAFKAFAE